MVGWWWNKKSYRDSGFSRSGALTPVFCFLVLLTLNPEGQSDDDIRCEIVV